MTIAGEFISGCMIGIEFINGAVVFDLGIIRLYFIYKDSP